MGHRNVIRHKSVVFDDELLAFENDVYRTERKVTRFSRSFPSVSFYRSFFWNVYRSSVTARRGRYGDFEWSNTSYKVLESLESVGVQLELSGVEHIRRLDSPCVFVSNHMSMFETMIMPAIIQPVRPVTFVVKRSLLHYPLFRHILRTRDPVSVSREHPREDFRAMMHGGGERLEKGISVVVFPQTTRSLTFDSTQFNTIGVKLAKRASVPVIPVALRTDAWGNGKWLKDLGRIDPSKKVHMAFGEPLEIRDRGGDQQAAIIQYIHDKLSEWGP
ncbi:MAG: lysophospholipid acyltransferase family protein [Planctomycetota bacterium]